MSPEYAGSIDREPSQFEGFMETLWVSGEEWVAFSSPSAQRGPQSNISLWRGHLFLIPKKVPCMSALA